MTTIGTPLAPSANRVMLLGSGELGKEVVIELQRFGCEVIAVDRYRMRRRCTSRIARTSSTCWTARRSLR